MFLVGFGKGSGGCKEVEGLIWEGGGEIKDGEGLYFIAIRMMNCIQIE